jgi:hypothetical protein
VEGPTVADLPEVPEKAKARREEEESGKTGQDTQEG